MGLLGKPSILGFTPISFQLVIETHQLDEHPSGNFRKPMVVTVR